MGQVLRLPDWQPQKNRPLHLSAAVPSATAQAELLKHKDNEKLQALELEGLVDLTPDSAVWVVGGEGRRGPGRGGERTCGLWSWRAWWI